MDYETFPFPPQRKIVVDAGYLGSRRHIIYGLLEVDVTRARQLLRARQAAGDATLSFTAFLAVCLAKSVDAHPNVQAYLDWRGRLVVFDEVDIVVMIEPRTGGGLSGEFADRVAMPHILRAANRKSVEDISAEIRDVQANPKGSRQRGQLEELATHIPRFARLLYFKLLKMNPHWFKRTGGTVVITSVGMFSSGGGWGLGFLPLHTTGLTVGGIAQKPGVHNGQIVIRDYLSLTLSFDHDVVDGAPAARFARTLVERIEGGAGLEDGAAGQEDQ